MSVSWFRVVGITVICLGMSSLVSAQSLTDEDLKHSQWSTEYEAFNGQDVQARLTFDGDSGTYGQSGELSNVTYKLKLGGGAEIKGRWSMNGSSGTFTFFVAGNSSPPHFSGAWQSSGRSGGWSGDFLRVVASNNNNNANNGRVQFGKWKKDPQKNRYYCEYRYPAKGGSGMKTQVCLWYPDDPQRSGYYYFVNAKNQIWGRCVCPANPDYDPNVMQWSKLKDDEWDDLGAGECPAPADGDPVGAAINEIPDPPA